MRLTKKGVIKMPKRARIRSIVQPDKKTCVDEVAEWQKTISEKRERLAQLKGPRGILAAKVLQREIYELERKVSQGGRAGQVRQVKPEPRRHYRASNQDVKRMNTTHRLLPVPTNQRNILLKMNTRAAQRWQTRKLHERRQQVVGRTQNVDQCPTCLVDRCVDKEMSIAVCPKCGATQRFATHIFETKEVDKDNAKITRQQSLSHMQKFTDQFQRGYPCMPLSVLETMTVAYSKIHVRDPAKVQLSTTNRLLKKLRYIPRMYKRAPDRMTRELKGQAIPEYTSKELTKLLNQRNRLHAQEEDTGDGNKPKKSFPNPIFMRQLGRANMMEQSRLFQNAKTTRIHLERIRAMDQECDTQRVKFGDCKYGIWSLYPST